jgi:hypothetical protein
MQENMFTDWLKRRKISDTVIKEFNVHQGVHEALGECIVIPIFNDQGEFSFNKYRRSPLITTGPNIYMTLVQNSSVRRSQNKDKGTVLITEGELDTLVAWSANIPAISSTGGSQSFQKEWVDKYLTDKEVILCFDNDEAGGIGMAKVFEFIPTAKILFIPDRPGVKDITDYVVNGGDLNELLKTAKRFDTLESVIDDRAARLSIWQNTWFHDAYIKTHTKPIAIKRNRGEIKDRILRAKSYPITELIEIKRNKATCLWHMEKEPSLAYYPKTNSLYCFGGCGRAYDAIDVYRQKYGCSFKEAVEKLQ